MGIEEELNRWKQAAAESAADTILDGMVVGLGSGSTAAMAVTALGRRVSEGLRITAVPTSEKTAERARSLGIALTTLAAHMEIDVTIDGADEVEAGTLNLIKGLGGALLREKIVATASRRLVIAVDETKLVERLGSHVAIPVEVIPFGWQAAARKLQNLGANPVLRVDSSGAAFISDGGHYILDCRFDAMESAERLGRELDRVVGVVEHGLFLGMTSEVRAAGGGGVKVLFRGES